MLVNRQIANRVNERVLQTEMKRKIYIRIYFFNFNSILEYPLKIGKIKCFYDWKNNDMIDILREENISIINNL